MSSSWPRWVDPTANCVRFSNELYNSFCTSSQNPQTNTRAEPRTLFSGQNVRMKSGCALAGKLSQTRWSAETTKGALGGSYLRQDMKITHRPGPPWEAKQPIRSAPSHNHPMAKFSLQFFKLAYYLSCFFSSCQRRAASTRAHHAFRSAALQKFPRYTSALVGTSKGSEAERGESMRMLNIRGPWFDRWRAAIPFRSGELAVQPETSPKHVPQKSISPCGCGPWRRRGGSKGIHVSYCCIVVLLPRGIKARIDLKAGTTQPKARSTRT